MNGRNKYFIVTYTIRSTAGIISPGFVAYVKMVPTKVGRSCSMVCMMMSYIFSWPLVTKIGSKLRLIFTHQRYTVQIYIISVANVALLTIDWNTTSEVYSLRDKSLC